MHTPLPRRERNLVLHLVWLAWVLALCGLSAHGAQAQAQTAPLTAPLTAASAATTAPGLIPLEDFFGRADMTNPLLSPSGRYLSYLRHTQTGHNVLVMLDLQDLQQSKALAGYSDADIFNVRWVGDDFLLYSLTDHAAAAAELDFAPGLFSVARAGGDPRQLIKLHNPFFVQGPTRLNDRRLSPNHVLLFVPQDDSHEVVIGRLSGVAGQLTGVLPLRLNLNTLQTRSVDSDAPANTTRWLFDAAGEPRVATVEADGRVRVHWRAPGSKEWQQILDADRLKAPWTPYAVDAAGFFYVVHADGPEGTLVLSKFDFAQGRPAATPTVEVPGFDFRGALVNERSSGRTLGVRALTDGEITTWIDPTLKALQDQIDQRLPGRVNRLSCRRCGRDDRVVLVESNSDRDPGSFFIWFGARQELLRLGRVLPAIDPGRMAHLDFKRIRARDGRDLPVWITLPARAPGAPPPPAVVLVHGGPMVRGGVWGWHALPQFLASRGYAVIEPEFRGSAGYGQAHLRAGWKQWGQAMQDDITDALRWAAAQGQVDGQRACIMGASYGGYAALMGLVRDPDLYRCGIAEMAVTDLMRLVEGSWWWRDDIGEEGRRYDLPAMVGDPKVPADADMLRAHSPVLLAARIKAPVLLVHGERDKRVPLVHARDMRKALQAAGNDPEWLTFDLEGHGWHKPENQLIHARRVEEFLRKHLPVTAGASTTQGVPMKR
jgi:dipeptidyl aminopeptidase/acylaminoacyl peptidase